ncbi:MAG: FapA family protein [Bacillota bacterium]
MTTELQVEAKSKDKARAKALEELQSEVDFKLSESDLELELLEESKGFLSLGSKKVYQVTVIDKEAADSSTTEDKKEVESEEEVEARDGEVELIIDEDGIFIKLIPPQGAGDEISVPQIENLLEANKIQEIDYDQVSEAITDEIYNQPIKIAERKPELDEDAQIEVEITEDEMEAYLSATPALGGKEATLEEIKSALQDSGVVYGIKDEKLASYINEEGILDQEIRDILIAEGREPTPGDPAEISFKFDTESKDRKVKELEDGRVDFLNLNRINNVEPGQVIATKKPPEEGEPGQKVTGEVIEPAPPEDKSIPGGKNTDLSSDDLTLKSEIEGEVLYNGNKVAVLPVHTVRGDVDLSTGNVDFVGTVVVEGDVSDGMEVKAKNNIQVKGSVHAANLEAGGEIVVNNGFVGKNKGLIKAEGDIKVKFIENGRAVTDQNLIVAEAIMHSDIDAASEVIVENKGLVVGGMVRAGKEIDAKVVGSNLGTTTKLFVGVTPELRDEYNQLKSELEDYQQELDEVLKTIKYLKKIKEEKGEVPDKINNTISQKTRTRFQLSKNIQDLKEEKESLEKRLKEGKHGKIKVKDKLYSGVELTIGTEVKRITKEITNVRYYIEQGEIKKGSYS